MPLLSELALLRDGWNGPGSKAISSRALANYAFLVNAFDNQIPEDLEPMAWDDGSIDLEWDRVNCRDSFCAQIKADGGMWLCILADRDTPDGERTYPEFDAQALKAFYETGRIEES